MNVLKYFKQITTFVFDIDGVLTDGSLWLLPDNMIRRMNVKDGYALQLALKKNYEIIIISGGYSPEAENRLKKLGVAKIFMSVQNKIELLNTILKDHNKQWSEVLFMGDDVPDCKVLQSAALPCCPADAVPEIKKYCKYISPKKGGQACVRDVVEKVLRLRGDWSEDPHVASK